MAFSRLALWVSWSFFVTQEQHKSNTNTTLIAGPTAGWDGYTL